MKISSGHSPDHAIHSAVLHAAKRSAPAACILAAAWAASFVGNLYLSLFIKVIVAASLYLTAMQLLHVETFREALAYLRKKKT